MLNDKELGQYLQDIRKQSGLSLRRVDELKGIAYSHLNMIEHGKRGVTPALLKNLADLYNVDYLDLYEKAGYIDLINLEKQPKRTFKVPVLGYIRAGIPIEAITDIIGDYSITEEKARKGKFFALKVKGDSMFPYILEDDIILFKQQNTCENGQICAVMVNGDDATIKIVKKDETGITLVPFNPMYQKIHYTNEEIINKPVIIAGVFEEQRRNNLNSKDI